MKLDYKTILALSFVLLVSIYYIYDIFIRTTTPYETDIIIIGSGLAGLSSAFELFTLSSGKLNIHLIESQPTYGGNSFKATSGINLLSTPIQRNQSIIDSFSLFYNDTMTSGHNQSDASLVSTLVTNSQELYSFYTSINLNLTTVSALGGHSVARTHRPTTSTIGAYLTSGLYNILTRLGNDSVTFMMNTSVSELIYNTNTNKVTGVYVVTNGKHKKKIKSKVIILATGGYAYDFENSDSLLKEYAEHLMKFPTTNGKFSKGEGIKIARQIGAELIQMENIQMHPTGFVDLSDRYNKNKILAPELLRGVGGILINQHGKRFCNELGRRDYVTKQIIMNCNKVNDEYSKHIDQYEAFVLLNDEMVKAFGKNIEFYINKKLIRKYKDVTAFAKEFGVDENNLRKTISEYKESMVKGGDEFGKVMFGGEFKYDDEVYVGVVTPSIHYTMGGIRINNKAEVVRRKGGVINGLFAAGEVTGGVHGGNRLGGNSLLECAVFGKIAAQSALDYLLKWDD